MRTSMAMRAGFTLTVVCLHLAAAAGHQGQELLEPGRAIRTSVGAGATRQFVIDVAAGDAVRLTVAGEGALIRVTVLDAGGAILAVRERLAGLRTPVTWTGVIDTAGPLALSVLSLDAESERAIVVTLDERRRAVTADRARGAAATEIEEAERLERSGAAQPSGALARYQAAAALWREAGDALQEASTLLEAGRLLLDSGRPADAVTAFTRAIALCRDAGDAACAAAGQHRLGRLYAVTGQPQPGADTLQEALARRERLGDAAGQAETLMELGGLEATRSGNDAAAAYLTRAVALARSVGDRRTEADALNMRAVLVAGLGETEQARELYESALAIRRAIGDDPGTGQTTSNLGVLHRGTGEPRRAIERYEEALAIRRRLGAMQPLANTLHNLGVVHADLGEHDTALALFREALDLWQKSGGRRGEAFTLQAIGQSYARLGDAARALEYYDRCAPVWKAVGDRRGEAQTLLAAATVRLGAGDHARALEGYAAAMGLARDSGYKREVALALLGRGSVRRTEGALDAALADARDAHELLAGIGARREQGRAVADMASALAALGRDDEARPLFEEALALYASVEDRAEQANVRVQFAQARERAGDLDGAHRHLTAALDLVESARAALNAEGLSISLFASRRPIYDRAIDVLLRMHARSPAGAYDTQAYAIGERLRARGLLDLLATGEMQPTDAQDPGLGALRGLQESINAKALRLTRLLGAPATRASAHAVAARREMDDLLARLDALYAERRRRPVSERGLADVVPVTLDETQTALLDDRTLLLSFVVGATRTVGWAVTDRTATMFTAPAPRTLEPLARRVIAAADAQTAAVQGEPFAARRVRLAQASTEMRAALATLAEHLLRPAAPLLDGRTRVLVVADGLLQSIPFAAMPVPALPATALGSRYEIVQLPSASVGVALAGRAAARGQVPAGVAVFADPVFSALDGRVARPSASPDPPDVLPRLRFSRGEADAIAALDRQSRVWSDFAATRAAFLAAPLQDYGVIHLAAHAVIDSERPQLSGVVLSQVDRQGRAVNGVLRLHELYGLRLHARLAVLSACRTALGRPVEGEGVIGLARGFLSAGADAVLASLWDVDDRATATFMSHFYRALLQGRQSPAAALRRARLAMQADPRFRDPADWAAFVLIGTGG